MKKEEIKYDPVRDRFLKNGVKMIAPDTVFFSIDTKIGRNVSIEPYVVIGKKVKMTQIFNENGHVVPVTLVEAGPCTVSQIKEEKDNGYNAVQLCLLYTSPSPRDRG